MLQLWPAATGSLKKMMKKVIRPASLQVAANGARTDFVRRALAGFKGSSQHVLLGVSVAVR